MDEKLKLEEAKAKIDQKQLFTSDYIEEIHNLSIRLGGSEEAAVAQIASDIDDRLELEERWQDELKVLTDKIRDTEDDKARLLIQTGNVSEELLQKNITDIKGMFEQKGRAERRLDELQRELDDLKKEESEMRKKFDELNPQNGQVKVYRDVHRVLDEVAKAFRNAKKENLRRFLGALEECANEYLAKLSAQDFHGEIRLCHTLEDSTEIKLFSSNGTEIKIRQGRRRLSCTCRYCSLYLTLLTRNVMRTIRLSLMLPLLHLAILKRRSFIM